jgi:hypothetical protein
MGLIAYFPFSGNANDFSGSGNNGTIYGGVTQTSDRFGSSSKAFSFDGASGYIEIPSLNSLPYSPISLSAWVVISSYFPLSAGHKFRSIMGRQQFGNTSCGMLGFYADQNVNNGGYDNTFSWWMGGLSSPDFSYSKIVPIERTWIHLVYTEDVNGNFNYYLNGVLTNSGVNTTVQNSNISFRIGAGIAPNSYFWDNKIDDIRIYKRILNSSEVIALYNE